MTRMLVPGAAMAAFRYALASLVAAACLPRLALAAWRAQQREPGLATAEIQHAVQRSKTVIAELEVPGSGQKPVDYFVSIG